MKSEQGQTVLWYGRAYGKVILHLAKYRHCSINGLLLGCIDKEDDNNTICILDAVPLFHQCLNTSPMIEIALTQIDAVAQNAGMSIIGYYIAGDVESEEPSEPIPGTKPSDKIAEKIAEHFPHALFVVNDNSKFSIPEGHAEFKVSQYHDGKWKLKDSNRIIIDEKMKDAIAYLIEQGAEKQLIDFDNHLDDITRDWSNPDVNKLVDDTFPEE